MSGQMLINHYFNMKTEIKNAKLVKVLEKRGVVVKEIEVINKAIKDLETDRNKLGYKMNALKDKTRLIVGDMGIEKDLGEFDVVTDIYIEKGKAYYDIENEIELYKTFLREKKEAEKK